MPKTMGTTALDLLRKIKERGMPKDISEADLIKLIKQFVGGDQRTIEAYLDYFVDIDLLLPIGDKMYRIDFEKADELMI